MPRRSNRGVPTRHATPSTEGTPLVAKRPLLTEPRRRRGILCVIDRDWATVLILLIVCFAMVGKEGSNGSLAASMYELDEVGYGDVVANLPGVGTTFYGLGKLSQVFANYHLGARLVCV